MSTKKYNIRITLNGEPYKHQDEPLSKRHLPMIQGVFCCYTRATVFDAVSGEILGIGHSPTRMYTARSQFFEDKPWRSALKKAVTNARARLTHQELDKSTKVHAACRRKKHITPGGES